MGDDDKELTYGFTPLHVAAYMGDIARFEALMSAGEKPTNSDRGIGVAGVAVMNGHPGVALDIFRYVGAVPSVLLVPLLPAEKAYLDGQAARAMSLSGEA